MKARVETETKDVLEDGSKSDTAETAAVLPPFLLRGSFSTTDKEFWERFENLESVYKFQNPGNVKLQI